jgi:hypothetical protein
VARRRLRRRRAGDRLDGASSRRGPLTSRARESGSREPPTPLDVFREKPGRRRLARARLRQGTECFFKHYPSDPARGAADRWKRALGLSPAAREFSLLRRLHAAGVGVPEPLALYRFAAGERVLVTRWIEGEPLLEALARPRRERRALLAATGALVARLHAAGFCHRDLHAGNLWVTASGPVLIDLPAALPRAPRWLRRRDLGELDRSLADALSLADRLRLRAAALGLARPFPAEGRAELRAVGRASEARRHAYLASRTRRCLRPGRLFVALHEAGAHGMRRRECDPARLGRLLAGEDAGEELQLLRFSGPAPYKARRLQSPARRAWLAGHGLLARGIGGAPPLAFAEWRRFGGRRRSALVLAASRTATPERLGGTAAWLSAVVELGTALRRDGVQHAGLESAELRLDARGALTLSGLEAIRFRRRLPARECARIDARVASWLRAGPAPAAACESALVRYAARTRFLPGPPAGFSRARS